ncbi:MAG: hypothetical protein R2800_13055 [Flavipsychrobacter sp.]
MNNSLFAIGVVLLVIAILMIIVGVTLLLISIKVKNLRKPSATILLIAGISLLVSFGLCSSGGLGL